LAVFLKAKAELTGGPSEWIGLIRNAEIVVTDSFHGSIFSILYNKIFYVCISELGDRIYNLLNVFNLTDCLCTPGTQLNLIKKIDWEKTNRILAEERKKSLNIITDMLKN
jgi:cephalosporin-C deacetylase-like acetyl esterase